VPVPTTGELAKPAFDVFAEVDERKHGYYHDQESGYGKDN